MGYVDDNLLSGEKIFFRTHLHWKVFFPSVLLALLAIACTVGLIYLGGNPYLSLLILIIPLGVLFHGYLTWRCSEFAVTDKRVLIKTGIVSRHTLETILTKIENIGVEQSIWGRLFNFGTLYVTGTGSTERRSQAFMRHWSFVKRLKRQPLPLRNGGRVDAVQRLSANREA